MAIPKSHTQTGAKPALCTQGDLHSPSRILPGPESQMVMGSCSQKSQTPSSFIQHRDFFGSVWGAGKLRSSGQTPSQCSANSMQKHIPPCCPCQAPAPMPRSRAGDESCIWQQCQAAQQAPGTFHIPKGKHEGSYYKAHQTLPLPSS